MSKGRHATPTDHTRLLRPALTTGLIALAPLSAVTPAGATDNTATWNAIIHCESRGAASAQNPTSSAGGYFQIIDSTWAAHGGLAFAPRAIDATFAQQFTIAQRIHDARGSFADWASSQSCWLPLIGTAPDILATAPIPKAVPKPAPAPPKPPPVVPKPAPVVPKAPKHAATEYIVVTGDTLGEIAKAHGLDWHQLATKNGLTTPYTIFPGDKLRLPAEKYTVQPGDTLTKIAGGDWHELYEANEDVIGPNPNLIFPGQVLDLTEGGTVVAQPTRPPVPPAAPVLGVGVQAIVPNGHLSQGFSLAHHGVDIAAPIGSSIHAAKAGTVYVSGFRDPLGFGAAIYIHNDDGTDSWYGHINTWLVPVGVHVTVGQPIATVGERGNAQGPHLHYELRTRGGTPLYPL